MDKYTIDETQYKNGYRKGYEDGKKDAVEVVHGEWLEEHGFDVHNNEYWVHCCSVCEEQALVDVLWREEQLTDYCPYCGAKMNGGKSEQT